MSRGVRGAALLVMSVLAAACGGYTASTLPVPNSCGEVVQDSDCHTLQFGGVTRAYLLHVPAGFHATTGALVVALHGSNGSGLRLMNTSGLNAKADQAGFDVVYPIALVSPGAG